MQAWPVAESCSLRGFTVMTGGGNKKSRDGGLMGLKLCVRLCVSRNTREAHGEGSKEAKMAKVTSV